MTSTTPKRALRIPDATDLYSTLITQIDNLGNDVDAILDYRWANAAARTGQTGMAQGQFGYQVDTQVRYRYNGTAWKEWESPLLTYVPTLTALSGSFSQGTGGSAAMASSYRWSAGLIIWNFSVTFGTTGAAMGLVPRVSTPAAIVQTPTGQALRGIGVFYDLSATTAFPLLVNGANSGYIEFSSQVASGTYLTTTYLDGGGTPVVFGAGDSLSFQVIAEAA